MDHTSVSGPVQSKQVHEGARATSALHALGGLTEEGLLESVEWGLRHAFDCTPHDPPNAAGVIAWLKIVRALRDRLVPERWTPNDANNYSTVVSPDETDAVAVAAGDSGTGRADAPLSTRTSKGPVTKKKADDNQLALFEAVAQHFPSPQPLPDTDLRTWLLLHYVDEEAEEIRVELSLPISVDDNGRVTGWRERIILTPIAHLPEPFSYVRPAEDEDDQTEIDIRRRA